MNGPQEVDPRQLLRAATWMRHAAGMTPQSASLRMFRKSFQTGGPRVFQNHEGPREKHFGQDFRAMQPPNFDTFQKPDSLGDL